jgi:hypothetical protein
MSGRLWRRAVAAETLQWVGLLGAALVWAGQHVVGFGTAVADCAVGSRHWGIGLDVWELALLAAAATLVLVSEAAAIGVLRETRGVEYGDPAPWGRRHFFALAAAVGNVLFLAIILMTGLASVYHPECRQA